MRADVHGNALVAQLFGVAGNIEVVVVVLRRLLAADGARVDDKVRGKAGQALPVGAVPADA